MSGPETHAGRRIIAELEEDTAVLRAAVERANGHTGYHPQSAIDRGQLVRAEAWLVKLRTDLVYVERDARAEAFRTMFPDIEDILAESTLADMRTGLALA